MLFRLQNGHHSSSYLEEHGEVIGMCAQYAQTLGIQCNNFIALSLSTPQ